jgi:Mn2+/Fe2+ NRAMP family transporter
MCVFLAAAVMLRPDWGRVAASLAPNLPGFSGSRDGTLYAYFAVALLSSIMLPYEAYFYASGVIEDKWGPGDLTLNRIVCGLGMGLGALLGSALVVIGAQVLMPAGVEPEAPGTAVLGPAAAFGRLGVALALGGMFFAFSGAAVETALSSAYETAQFFGWPWGKWRAPKKAARFSLTWIVVLVAAALVVETGVDPVAVVEYSIVFSVVILPLTYFPLLVAARDRRYMGEHANGLVSDALGWLYFAVITVAAVSALPLLVLTHGGKG